MQEQEQDKANEDGQFEVGAVARMVGVSPNTLRTWERRNFVQAATRTASGRRRYTSAQVEKIALLKKLTEAGDSIGSIANLEIESLRKRVLEFQTRGTEQTSNRRGITKILTVGENAALWTSILPANFISAKEQNEKPDIVVCELGRTLSDFRQNLAIIRHEHPNTPLAVIYDYAPRGAVSEISAKGIFLIHAPCSAELLAHYIHAAVAGSSQQSSPNHEPTDVQAKRLFTEKQLALIASSNPSIKCECPHHISALVSSLSSFERYCHHCEKESPSDAELHTYLGNQIAKARVIVEEALLYLCTKDNIAIPADTDR